MAKRQLSASEAFDLRQALHVATLEALMASRRWEPGDIAFQGGTSLHLAHGSPRFSEDLDFLVKSSLDLERIGESIQKRLKSAQWIPSGTSLVVTKAKDGHNPHAFNVSVSGPNVVGGVRVKVELWQTAAQTITALKVSAAPVRLAAGPGAGMQAFVPTADLAEIHVDKVFALAARPYLKPRDVFDLHWLSAQGVAPVCTVEDMRVRLATYPNVSPAQWLAMASARLVELQGATDRITEDLKRWLPAHWPMTAERVHEMVSASAHALEQGMEVMQEIAAADDELPGPDPEHMDQPQP